MSDVVAYSIFIIVVILFFYFGYRQDYRRNPKQFMKTIIGVPIGVFSSIIGLFGITTLIKKWIKKEE